MKRTHLLLAASLSILAGCAHVSQAVPENKELLIIPGASHCDLYDGGYTGLEGKGESRNCIPWDKLEDFFSTNLR